MNEADGSSGCGRTALPRTRTSALTLLLASLGMFCAANVACARESLRVVERELTNKTLHLGAKGAADSVGDMIVFANPIFDASNTHQLGVIQGNCVRVIVGKSWECFFTLDLGADRLTLEGPYADTGESVFAITGGTGRYKGAKGQMSLRVDESKPSAKGSPPLVEMVYDIL
jgi:allene oxide cyclase